MWNNQGTKAGGKTEQGIRGAQVAITAEIFLTNKGVSTVMSIPN